MQVGLEIPQKGGEDGLISIIRHPQKKPGLSKDEIPSGQGLMTWEKGLRDGNSKK